MKTNVKKEMHTKTVIELRKLLKDEQSALLNLQLDFRQNKLKNTSSLSTKRKDIAVIQTVLNSKVKEVKNG